jgi:hypothetical protein
MDKSQKVDLHKKVAERLKKAAECHERAAENVKNDQMKEACHEGMIAFGHILHAKDHIVNAAKNLVDKS